MGAGRQEEVGRYAQHIVDQAEHHLLTQEIAIVGGTPPLIAALCKRDVLVERMQDRVRGVTWGGASMDADTRHLYRTELFPGARVAGGYGTTMALGGGATERPGLAHGDPCIFDPFSPYVTFSVVDPETLDPVPFGERGQLLVNHVSKSFFMPGNLERDVALRVPSPSDRVGDVRDVTGAVALSLSIVPVVFVSRAMSALRRAALAPFDQRVAAIEAAVDLFAHGTVDGMDPDASRTIVAQVTGSPISVVRRSMTAIETAGRSLRQTIAAATPRGGTRDISDPALLDGGALWVPRGRTLAVHAAGNSPAIHASWLPALALGLRIAVRPSRREPLTPYRLITTLRQSGFGDDQVMLLATDYAGADEMLRASDLGLVFGGEDIVAKYGSDPTLSVQGSGRSKIAITADVDWHDHLDVIVESVSGGGGANCMNASALLIEGDAGAISEAIAQRLASLPVRPPLDEEAVLPVRAAATAAALERHALDTARGSRVWLGGDGIRGRSRRWQRGDAARRLPTRRCGRRSSPARAPVPMRLGGTVVAQGWDRAPAQQPRADGDHGGRGPDLRAHGRAVDREPQDRRHCYRVECPVPPAR